MKIFFIKDPNGKISSDEARPDRDSCLIAFARSWNHPETHRFIDFLAARDHWAPYEKAGWEIVEMEMQKAEFPSFALVGANVARSFGYTNLEALVKTLKPGKDQPSPFDPVEVLERLLIYGKSKK